MPPATDDDSIQAAGGGRRVWSPGTPRIYRDASVSDFPGLSTPSEPRDVLITGDPGVGKSHLAAALLNRWQSGRWLSLAQWLLRMRSSRCHHEVYAEASDPGVLVLDDLGAAYQGEYSRSMLLALLDDRIGRRAVTVVTTAQASEEIRALDPAIHSRLGAFFIFRLRGPTRRVPSEKPVDYRWD